MGDKNLLSGGPFPEEKCTSSLPPHSQKQPVWHIYHEKKQGVKEGMALVHKNVGNLGERMALRGKYRRGEKRGVL